MAENKAGTSNRGPMGGRGPMSGGRRMMQGGEKAKNFSGGDRSSERICWIKPAWISLKQWTNGKTH